MYKHTHLLQGDILRQWVSPSCYGNSAVKSHVRRLSSFCCSSSHSLLFPFISLLSSLIFASFTFCISLSSFSPDPPLSSFSTPLYSVVFLYSLLSPFAFHLPFFISYSLPPYSPPPHSFHLSSHHCFILSHFSLSAPSPLLSTLRSPLLLFSLTLSCSSPHFSSYYFCPPLLFSSRYIGSNPV